MDTAAPPRNHDPHPLPWFPAAPAAPPSLAGGGCRTVAVVGACGGAGTSTLAAGVAHGLRRVGGSAALVDLDTAGGGVDVLLGIEAEPGARWPELADARGVVDGAGLLAALPRWHAVPVLSANRLQAPPPDDAVAVDVVTGLLHAGQDVVLDLGRPAAWTVAGRLLARAADVVLLVAPCTAQGVAGAVATLGRLRLDGVPDPWLVVRGPVAGRVDAGAMSAALGIEAVAQVRWDRRLGGAVERGDGPPVGRLTPLARTGRELAGSITGTARGHVATAGAAHAGRDGESGRDRGRWGSRA